MIGNIKGISDKVASRKHDVTAVAGAAAATGAVEVGLPKLTRHMMRHTFATFLGSKGATDMDLMDVNGSEWI